MWCHLTHSLSPHPSPHTLFLLSCTHISLTSPSPHTPSLTSHTIPHLTHYLSPHTSSLDHLTHHLSPHIPSFTSPLASHTLSPHTPSLISPLTSHTIPPVTHCPSSHTPSLSLYLSPVLSGHCYHHCTSGRKVVSISVHLVPADTAFSSLLPSPPQPYGSALPGAVVKLSTTDRMGHRMRSVCTLTFGHAHHLPFIVFGLGQTPSLIEELEVSTPYQDVLT